MSRFAPAAGLAALATVLLCLSAPPAHAKGGEVGGVGSTYYLNDSWTGQANRVVTFGERTNKAYVGDWNDDGYDDLAVRDGDYYLVTIAGGEPPDGGFSYGRATDVTLFGDWDGDGIDTPAVRRGRDYFFTNGFGGTAEVVIRYGRPDDQVLVGDWNADGIDTPAVRRGATYS